MDTELQTLQNIVNTASAFVVDYGFQIIGAIIVLVLGLWAARWAARGVERLCERTHLDVTLSRFIANIARTLVLIFVVIIVLGKFGLNISPLIAALGAVAFGGTLALQGPLSNYGAGISIILARPFVVGNTLTVQGVSGVVEEITLANTRLRTEDDERITIPNKKLVDEILVNSFENRIVEGKVSISYSDDPETAIQLIDKVLAEQEGVVGSPPAQIGIQAFADSAIELAYRYWVPTDRYFEVQFATNQCIYAALMSAGIHIPYPQREVRLLEGQAQGG